VSFPLPQTAQGGGGSTNQRVILECDTGFLLPN